MFNDESPVMDGTEETDIQEEETTEESAETEGEQSKDWESEAKKWKAIAERRDRRAKETPAAQSSAQSVEETVLKTLGMDDDSLTYLKKVAAVNGLSLAEAQRDQLFVTYKQVKEQELKAKEASVGASKGSGQRSKTVAFSTPGLSEDQHKALWKKSMGM
jgi:hypothetical protein